MPLRPDQIERMLRDSRESAAAFLEDIQYFREVVARPDPSRGELRRLSGTLRRLLLDRGLTIVAAPRMGGFFFRAPDTLKLINSWPKGAPGFFITGGATVYGMDFHNIVMCPVEIEKYIDNSVKDSFVQLKLDGFLSQRVLYLNGGWVCRKDVIKYVAYVASGIHEKTSMYVADEVDRTISQIRRSAYFVNKVLSLQEGLFRHPPFDADRPFEYSPETVDVILWELLSIVHFIATSADVTKLESIVKAELKIK